MCIGVRKLSIKSNVLKLIVQGWIFIQIRQKLQILQSYIFVREETRRLSKTLREDPFIISKMTTTIGDNRARVQSASDSVPYKFARGDFRIRLVAYLARCRRAVLRAPCSMFVCLIPIARFDQKGLYIRMTCGWLISNYAKLRRHVEKRSRRGSCRRERARERKQRASIGSVSDACREEKSTRLEITINLRSRLRRSKLIRFESINKKLNVT